MHFAWVLMWEQKLLIFQQWLAHQELFWCCDLWGHLFSSQTREYSQMTKFSEGFIV
jgi:hypothetical protein